MPLKENLYFIAIVPPEDICKEITAFKIDMENRFLSKHALKVLPHITLKAPFKIPVIDHERVVEWFCKTEINVSPFQQRLEGFGAFDNKQKPVIFVQPVINDDLKNLQRQVLYSFGKTFQETQIVKTELDFKPHITIAYRDLSPLLFHKAWSEYRLKKYSALFEVKQFQLFQHNGKAWNSVSIFHLL